jgi:hypothetical protein
MGILSVKSSALKEPSVVWKSTNIISASQSKLYGKVEFLRLLSLSAFVWASTTKKYKTLKCLLVNAREDEESTARPVGKTDQTCEKVDWPIFIPLKYSGV